MKTSFQKKTSALMLAVMMGTASAPAAAGFVDDFFDDVWVQTTDARIYDTQRRGGIIGGSISVRIPNKSISVVNFTPPSFEAGCGGIDMNFGAFGFIDGQELIELLKRIGQQAKALLFQIAVETLNQMLGGLMKEFAAKVQSLNEMLRSSCDLASGLAGSVVNAFGTTEKRAEAGRFWSEKINKAKGIFTDWDGVKNAYVDPKSAWRKATDQEKEMAKVNPAVGNLTWRAMQMGNAINDIQFGAARAGTSNHNEGLAMLMLSNIVGTSLTPVLSDEDSTKCKGTPKDPGGATTPEAGTAPTSGAGECTKNAEVMKPTITNVSDLANPSNIKVAACIDSDAPSSPDDPAWAPYIAGIYDSDCDKMAAGVLTLSVVFPGTKSMVNKLIFGIAKAELSPSEKQNRGGGLVAYLRGDIANMTGEEIKILSNMEIPILGYLRKVQRDPQAVQTLANLFAGPMAEREALRMARSFDLAARNVFSSAADKVNRPDEFDFNQRAWSDAVRAHEATYGDKELVRILMDMTTYVNAVYSNLQSSAVGVSRS